MHAVHTYRASLLQVTSERAAENALMAGMACVMELVTTCPPLLFGHLSQLQINSDSARSSQPSNLNRDGRHTSLPALLNNIISSSIQEVDHSSSALAANQSTVNIHNNANFFLHVSLTSHACCSVYNYGMIHSALTIPSTLCSLLSRKQKFQATRMMTTIGCWP